jgi:DNA-binding NarL/FixJ family response regulator
MVMDRHALDTKGAAVASEEVRRVVEAIDALGAVDDTMDRAKALTELLDDWPDHHSRVRAMRQQAVQALVAAGMTYRQIASELDISPARVGQIVAGVTNPRTQKNPPPKEPRTKAPPAAGE